MPETPSLYQGGIRFQDGTLQTTASVTNTAVFPPISLFTKSNYRPGAASGRALATTYQNTTGQPLVVMGAVQTSGTNAFTLVCDANASPTTVITEGVGFAGWWGTFYCIVPPNYYYKVTATSGTLQNWIEWKLNSGTVTASGELSGSRAVGTVYQNTSGFCKFVIADIAQSSSGATLTVTMDSAASPLTVVIDWIALSATGKTTVMFPVPNNYYYKITATAGGSVAHWNEYTMPFQATQSLELSVATSTNPIWYTTRASSISYVNMSKDVYVSCSGQTNSAGQVSAAYTMGTGYAVANSLALSSPSFPNMSCSLYSTNSGQDGFVTALAQPMDPYWLTTGGTGTLTVSHYFEWLLG